MKKILLIFILCIIKLNAYEYIVRNQSGTLTLYKDSNGVLGVRRKFANGSQSSVSIDQSWAILDGIKISNGGTSNYITATKFNEYLINDIDFLNDFYTQQPQQILNYYYNSKRFSLTNHIIYENYEILYNSDGLAVESIVNGIWRGLYDGPDNSGYLYNEKEDLKYINGVPVSFFEKINDKLMKKFNINLESIFMKKIFYPLLFLIFACVIFRAVIRMAVKAFLIRFYDNKIRRLEKRRENIENA